MKGLRFYEEMSDKRRGISAGNVAAVSTDPLFPGQRFPEALAAVFTYANSPVQVTAVDPNWVRKNCRRVSEARARHIHPKLFARLDTPEHQTTLDLGDA